WMRFAGRLGIALDQRKLDKFAIKAGLRLCPQLLHRADILARNRPSALEINAHYFALVAQPSGTDAKNKSAAGIMVQGCDFFGQDNRMTFGDQANPGAETDGPGGRRSQRQTDKGIDHLSVGFWNLAIFRKWIAGFVLNRNYRMLRQIEGFE